MVLNDGRVSYKGIIANLSLDTGIRSCIILECIKLQYTLQCFRPEEPSSGILEHTETSNVGGYLYIQGMIAS